MRDSRSQIDAAKEQMLDVLLAEVRRVRRWRRVRAVSGAAAIVLLALGAAVMWSPGRPGSPSLPGLAEKPQPMGASTGSEGKALAHASDATTLLDERGRSVQSTPSVRVEIVTGRPDERWIVGSVNPSVRVEIISTEQAYAILQATGQRYGLIEYAGHVEFVQIAAK